MLPLKRIIITGANKGVGFGIIENLCQKQYEIIMACRNLQLAQESKLVLDQKYGLQKDKIQIIQLDVSDYQSIDNFIQDVQQRYGQVDCIINNAGIAFKGDRFDYEVVTETFKTNYYGTSYLCQKITPLIKQKGKIINITSMAGFQNILFEREEIKKQFISDKTSFSDLENLIQEYFNAVKNENYLQLGWPKQGYGMSKVCLNKFTQIFANSAEIKQKQIQVYACCPGWVRTDMAGSKAPLSIEEGALTPVYLAELPYEVDLALQGQFFQKEQLSSLN